MKKEPSVIQTQHLFIKFRGWLLATDKLLRALGQLGENKIGLELRNSLRDFNKSFCLKLEKWSLIIPEDKKV